MKHLMIDLETLGVTPGCAILSVGAVYFDPHMGELGDEFYRVAFATLGEQEKYGLKTEKSTLDWWNDQSPEARKVMNDTNARSLHDVLIAFDRFFGGESPGALVYGNGADFDLPILAAAYRAVGLPQPWGKYDVRCYRTLKNLAPHIKIDRKRGVHHNAIADAIAQAEHLMAIVAGTTLTLA